jgi:hypothetical protein
MTPHAPTDRHTTRSRDAAIRRLSRANRWLLAGSAVLTAAFTAAAATAFPGRKSTSGATRSVRTRHADPRSNATGATHLQAPAQAPRTSTQQGSGESSAPAESNSASSPESSSAQGDGSASESGASSGASESTESAPVVSGGS